MYDRWTALSAQIHGVVEAAKTAAALWGSNAVALPAFVKLLLLRERAKGS
jgi:hypothetical protein